MHPLPSPEANTFTYYLCILPFLHANKRKYKYKFLFLLFSYRKFAYPTNSLHVVFFTLTVISC